MSEFKILDMRTERITKKEISSKTKSYKGKGGWKTYRRYCFNYLSYRFEKPFNQNLCYCVNSKGRPLAELPANSEKEFISSVHFFINSVKL